MTDEMDYEQLGLFYLGRRYDAATRQRTAEPVLYDSSDLLTHAVCIGMTGSGKTGLGITLIEEAAIDGLPVLAIDPKGDLANLMLTFPGLSAQEFAPWVNPDEARTQQMSVDEFAAKEAARWKAGLADWDEDGDRIRRLKAAADVSVYTPGSRAGLPLSILETFNAPPLAVRDEPETLTLAPGVRLPRFGRDMVWAAPKRTRKLLMGSITMFNDGRVSSYLRSTVIGTGAPARKV